MQSRTCSLPRTWPTRAPPCLVQRLACGGIYTELKSRWAHHQELGQVRWSSLTLQDSLTWPIEGLDSLPEEGWLDTECNWDPRMRRLAWSWMVVCFVKSWGIVGGLAMSRYEWWVSMLLSTSPREIVSVLWWRLWEWYIFQASAGQLGRPPLALGIGPFSKRFSWRLHMANALNSHWTWSGCMGHCICTATVIEEQGLFPATGNNHIFNRLLWRHCIWLHAMPFIFLNSLPCSVNIIAKINLKLITLA